MSIWNSKSSQGRVQLALAVVALTLTPQSVRASWFNPFHRSASVKTLQARDAPPWGFYDPDLNGGSWLTSVPNTYPPGLGEPLNVIISAWSDYDVLQDKESDGGLRNYFLSLGFSGECLGQSLGSKQAANVGDGHGLLNETAVIRWNYGDPYVGSCKETIEGGNHFRYWTQNGPDAKSGAVFLAVSYELPIDKGHDLIQNGYNLARDWLVGNATGQQIANPNPLMFEPTPPQISSSSVLAASSLASVASTASIASLSSLSLLPSSGSVVASPAPTQAAAQPQPTLNAAGGTGYIAAVPNGQYVGTTSANNYSYQTTVTYYSGLLGNTSVGINHYITVEQDGRPAVDGLIAVFDVKIISRPDGCVVKVFGHCVWSKRNARIKNER
ncbi:hypothetical protein FRC04_003425 [Tulasnella sp. 424]|nr:hypothetical protein FRC04_003425 [Tulasnella sp. 424]KAG8977234.1 hypothetical protein FRC05_002234 [Tulasnella sp. 425]